MKSQWTPSTEDVKLLVLIAIIFGSFAWFTSGVVEYARTNSTTQLAQVSAPGAPNDFGSGATLLTGLHYGVSYTGKTDPAFYGPVVGVSFSKNDPNGYSGHVNNADYASYGISFTDAFLQGWSTLQRTHSGSEPSYLTPGSSTIRQPGAPTGMSGTEITFAKPVIKAGLEIQNGTPFDINIPRSSFQIRVTAYDESNTKIFEQEVRTCEKEFDSCSPRLIGVYSPNKPIKKIQYTRVGSSGFYAMDNLMFQHAAFKFNEVGVLLGNAGRHINFSEQGIISGTLSNQYVGQGVIFNSDLSQGFGVSQANGFISTLSGPTLLPGAPAGTKGTEITFIHPVSSAGIFVNSGAPFNSQKIDHPAENIRVTAYDVNGDILNEWTRTTCYKEFDSCEPHFIGIDSSYANIKKLRIVKLDEGLLSLDDLYFFPPGQRTFNVTWPHTPGTYIPTGSQQVITWQSPLRYPNVDIYLDVGNDKSETPIMAQVIGQNIPSQIYNGEQAYTWNVPAVPPAIDNGYRIRICETGVSATSSLCGNGNGFYFGVPPPAPQLLSVTCQGSQAGAGTNNVVWAASPSGGQQPYYYAWAGVEGLSGTTQLVSKTYATPGTKTASVNVFGANGDNVQADCSVTIPRRGK